MRIGGRIRESREPTVRPRMRTGDTNLDRPALDLQFTRAPLFLLSCVAFMFQQISHFSTPQNLRVLPPGRLQQVDVRAPHSSPHRNAGVTRACLEMEFVYHVRTPLTRCTLWHLTAV